MLGASSYPTGNLEVSHAEAVGRFFTSATDMVHRARRARSTAPSYRVKVGACALAVNPYTGESTTRSKSNIKPTRDKETICGDTRAVEEVEKTDAGAFTIALAVAGPTSPDTIRSISQNIQTCTLHPCWRCRAELDAFDSVTDQTLILTFGGGDPDFPEENRNLYQAHTYGQLKNLYRVPQNVEVNQATPMYNTRFKKAGEMYLDLVAGAELTMINPEMLAIEALLANSDLPRSTSVY